MDSKEIVAEYIRLWAAEHNMHCELQHRLEHVFEVMTRNRNHQFVESFSVHTMRVGYDKIYMALVNDQDGECFQQLDVPVSVIDASDSEILEFARRLDWDEAIKMDAERTATAERNIAAERKMYESLKKKFEPK